MEIRACKYEDETDVYDLICQLEETKFDYQQFQLVYRAKLTDLKNNYLVGIQDAKVVGFISVYIDYQLHHVQKIATIEELIIQPDYRNQHLGQQLLQSAINLALENDCEAVELTSNLKRLGAHRFYQQNGFCKTSYKFVRVLQKCKV